jgi:hypothetical protein
MGTKIQAGNKFYGGVTISNGATYGAKLYYLVSSHLPSDYAVYLYDESGNELVRIPKPNDASDSWGNQIATNGTKIAITNSDNIGALYIYDMDGSNMVQVTSSDASGSVRFGSQLEINSTKIIVGAIYAGPIHQQGSVYVYDLDGTNEVKITASDASNGDQFSTWGGLAVSESKIFVGSGNHDNKRGALYIYDMDGSNEVKVQPSDNAQNDEFGYIVVASETKVVATAAGSGAHGAAYIFDHDGTNEVKVEPSVDSRNNAFGGASAAINDTHIAIADRSFNGNKGAVYIYNIDGSNEVRIEHPSHFAAYDFFGYNLAMSSSKVFTCPPNDDDGGSSTGNVYEYNLDGTGERTLPTPSTFAAGSRFGQGLHIYDSSLVPSAPIFRAPPPLAEPYVIQDDISTNPPSINTSYGFYPVDEAAGHTINDNSFLNYGNQTGSIFLQKGDWTVVGDSTGNDEDSYLDIYYQNEKNNKTYAWNHSTDILGGGQGVTNRIRPVSTILTETHIFVTTVLYTSPNTTTIFKVNLSSGVVEGTYVFSNFNSSTTAGIYISDDVIYLPSNNAIARYDISSNTQLSTWSESHIAGSGYMNGKFNNGFDVKGDTIVAVADWNSSASFPNTGDGKEHVIAIDKNTGVRKWGIRYTGISGTIHWTGYPFEGLHLLGDDKVSILTFINGVYTPLVYDIPTDTVSNLIGTLNDGQNNSTKYVDIRTIGDYLLILAQYNNSHMKKLHWYHKDDLTTPVMTTGIGLITNTQDLTGGGYAQHGIFVQDDLKLHYLNKPDGSGTHNSGTKVDVWEFTLSGTTITDSHPTFIAPPAPAAPLSYDWASLTSSDFVELSSANWPDITSVETRGSDSTDTHVMSFGQSDTGDWDIAINLNLSDGTLVKSFIVADDYPEVSHPWLSHCSMNGNYITFTRVPTSMTGGFYVKIFDIRNIQQADHGLVNTFTYSDLQSEDISSYQAPRKAFTIDDNRVAMCYGSSWSYCNEIKIHNISDWSVVHTLNTTLGPAWDRSGAREVDLHGNVLAVGSGYNIGQGLRVVLLNLEDYSTVTINYDSNVHGFIHTAHDEHFGAGLTISDNYVAFNHIRTDSTDENTKVAETVIHIHSLDGTYVRTLTPASANNYYFRSLIDFRVGNNSSEISGDFLIAPTVKHDWSTQMSPFSSALSVYDITSGNLISETVTYDGTRYTPQGSGLFGTYDTFVVSGNSVFDHGQWQDDRDNIPKVALLPTT